MDLQTRKLNLISFLAQIQDEMLFNKIEDYILTKSLKKDSDFIPFTIDELMNRIEKSEQDYQNKKFKTQDELEKASENW